MTPLLAAILFAQRAPDVTLDFTSPKGLIVVQTLGNEGQSLGVLVDTGAQRTVVDRDLADRLKLEKGAEVKARGAGGTVEAHFVKGLQLNGLGERSLEAVALPLTTIGAAVGTKIDVILGQDVLSKHVVGIDRNALKVTLSSRPPEVPSSATVVSLSLRGGRPYLPASVMLPDGRRATADLLLDTGSDTVAELAQPYAEEIGMATKPDPNGRSILGVGGVAPLRIAELLNLQVGRETVGAEDVRVFHRPADSAGDGDGRVGNGFLARYKAVIDGPGLKLVLMPLRRP